MVIAPIRGYRISYIALEDFCLIFATGLIMVIAPVRGYRISYTAHKEFCFICATIL